MVRQMGQICSHILKTYEVLVVYHFSFVKNMGEILETEQQNTNLNI